MKMKLLLSSLLLVYFCEMISFTQAGKNEKGSVIVINNHGGSGGGHGGGGGIGTCGGHNGEGQEATTIVKMDPKKGNTIIVKGGSSKKKSSGHEAPQVDHMPLHFPVPIAIHYPHFHHHLQHHHHPQMHSESHQQPLYNHQQADASHQIGSYVLRPRFIGAASFTQQQYQSPPQSAKASSGPAKVTTGASKLTESTNSAKGNSVTSENENLRRVAIDYPVYVKEPFTGSHEAAAAAAASVSSSMTSAPIFVRETLNEAPIESRSSNEVSVSPASETQVNLPVFTRD